ncbi:MAG: DUF2071 domain-containing protein [Phycisphaerales bacterium]|nr:DUF2071 domain-containing protein [Phycisphaerales bacterium]
MPFLTATWHSLSLLNFIVDPAVLKPHLPVGTELDTYHGDTYMSLVAFHWQDTRVLGLSVPFHRHFEELNLRFYARRKTNDGWRHGVVFVKELVPRRAVAALARWVYSEPFQHAHMVHVVDHDDDTCTATAAAVTRTASIGLTTVAPRPQTVPPEGSLERLLTDHQWGWTQRRGRCFEYEVRHAPWRVSAAEPEWFTDEMDLIRLYGVDIGLELYGVSSALYCDGSHVEVMRGRRV